MARTQQSPATHPDYLEYFGLSELPFARLGDPASIFPAEQYGLLMSHLASATAETDCLVVLRGVAGSGKTTLLNAYLSELEDETFFATIDNSCRTATDFYGTFLRQLGFKDISGTLRELRRITEQFLQHQASGGNTVLLVIDNAQTVRPVVLEQLRHVADGTFQGRRVLSVVIAGNADLSRVLESPAMSKLKFRSHVNFHIRMFDERESAEYIRYRLAQAGGGDIQFDVGAMDLVHRFTGGCPAPINKLCHSLLMEACNEDTHSISEQMVRAVASSLDLLPHVVPLHGRGRRRSDKEPVVEEQITARAANRKKPQRQQQQTDDTITRLKASLAEMRTALRQSEQSRKAAVTELRKEQRALKRALVDARKNREQYEKAEETRLALESSVAELTADLRMAEKLGSELETLEGQLTEARGECEALRQQAEDIPKLERAIADKDARIASLTAEMAELANASTATQTMPPDHEDLPPPRKKRKTAPGAIERLEISRNDQVEQVLELRDAPSRVMIGRDEDSDLRLDSEFVSRHHALMFIAEDGVRIEDLNSSNGTIVNMKKMSRADIEADDLIIIGDFRIHAIPAED